jgi:ribosomal protein S1
MKTFIGTVGKRLKGGHEVRFGAGNTGFLAEAETLGQVHQGRKIPVVVTNATMAGDVSGVEVSHKEALAVLDTAAQGLSIGALVAGEVTGLTHFGAFVEIDAASGLQALLPTAEIVGGQSSLKDFALGTVVQAMIIRRRKDAGKWLVDISQVKLLERGMFQLDTGSIVRGFVTKITESGAFVKCNRQTGLLHRKNMQGDLRSLKVGTGLFLCVLRTWSDESGRLRIDFGNKKSVLGKAIETVQIEADTWARAVVCAQARDGWNLTLDGLPAFLPASELVGNDPLSIRRGARLRVRALSIDVFAGRLIVTRKRSAAMAA